MAACWRKNQFLPKRVEKGLYQLSLKQRQRKSSLRNWRHIERHSTKNLFLAFMGVKIRDCTMLKQPMYHNITKKNKQKGLCCCQETHLCSWSCVVLILTAETHSFLLLAAAPPLCLLRGCGLVRCFSDQLELIQTWVSLNPPPWLQQIHETGAQSKKKKIALGCLWTAAVHPRPFRFTSVRLESRWLAPVIRGAVCSVRWTENTHTHTHARTVG